MSDKIDEAQQTAEYLANVMINNARNHEPVAKETGHCLNCGEQINQLGRRWCNADCRDDWEKEFNARGMKV